VKYQDSRSSQLVILTRIVVMSPKKNLNPFYYDFVVKQETRQGFTDTQTGDGLRKGPSKLIEKKDSDKVGR
jgi:hypothetical protein